MVSRLGPVLLSQLGSSTVSSIWHGKMLTMCIEYTVACLNYMKFRGFLWEYLWWTKFLTLTLTQLINWCFASFVCNFSSVCPFHRPLHSFHFQCDWIFTQYIPEDFFVSLQKLYNVRLYFLTSNHGNNTWLSQYIPHVVFFCIVFPCILVNTLI